MSASFPVFLRYTLLVLALAAGALSGATLVVGVLAGMANASPELLANLTRWAWCLGLGSLAALLAAGVIGFTGRPLTGALIAAVPTLFLISVLLWLTISSVFLKR